MTAAEPIRRCILLGDRAPRGSLIRLALSPDGQVLPDVRAKAPGRGAWIGVTRVELEQAIAKGKLKGALARAFKAGSGKTGSGKTGSGKAGIGKTGVGKEDSGPTGPILIPDNLPDLIATALERSALDRLGLEARTGNLLIGTERIEAAARSGKLELLLHASDAGEDGNRKLDQAWRVGRAEEGSDLRGLALPVPRTILGVALGRQNVVHVGLTERDAAGRVREALTRWRHFIGPDLTPVACETRSQGATALRHEPAGPNEPGRHDGPVEDGTSASVREDTYEEFE